MFEWNYVNSGVHSSKIVMKIFQVAVFSIEILKVGFLSFRRSNEGAKVPLHVQSSSVRPEPGQDDAAEGGGAHLLKELVLQTQSFGWTRRAMGLLERMVALLRVLWAWNSYEDEVVRQCLL